MTRRAILSRAVGATLWLVLAACGGEPAVTRVEASQGARKSTAEIPTVSATATSEPAASATATAEVRSTVVTTNTPRPTAVSTTAVVPQLSPTPVAQVATSPTATSTPQPEVTPTEAPVETDDPTASPNVESVSLPPAEPYVPGDRQSILDRYAVDAARADAVLNSGLPVFLSTDAIW